MFCVHTRQIKAPKHSSETREEITTVYLRLLAKHNMSAVGVIWVPVQSKYIVELDILMSSHQTHGQVVQSLHQFDHGIVVLRKEGAELQ